MRTTAPFLATCAAVLTLIAPAARAADLADDAVLAPGTLERQRPMRRLVGRRLASDAPLAPGTVKRSARNTLPCPPEILPPGSASAARR